ncbi:TetR/AcrR family transcriptional regulator [Kurthia senegalensis]|uniref:TetR/AcrR family transcriptional regulator n=1 Tax=Kurthia senegalensis TaxID=1033740 RepID=UPI00028A0683|nr:TetR/AcrR family transcriptional regulator [Kurthia senegalensis]
MTTKGERTKQHILQQSLLLFSKNSFKNVTMRQIAKEANVSPALIYKYFPTQEELYYATMQTASHELLEKLQSNDTLEDIVDAYLEHMLTTEVLFEIMAYFSLDRDQAENDLPILDEVNQFLTLLEPKISSTHAKIEAQLLFSTLNGLIISYKKIPHRNIETKIEAVKKLAHYYVSHLKQRI